MYLPSKTAENPTEIKERLMKLVSKGQIEAEMEEEQKKSKITPTHSIKDTINKAKDDAEMYEKSFL